MVQPAPQRPGTLSAPLQPTPEALLRIYRGAPRVSAVQPARNWREADFAPLQAEGIRASIRPALRLLRGRPAGADVGVGPRQGRRHSADLGPGQRSVRGCLGPARGPRQLRPQNARHRAGCTTYPWLLLLRRAHIQFALALSRPRTRSGPYNKQHTTERGGRSRSCNTSQGVKGGELTRPRLEVNTQIAG